MMIQKKIISLGLITYILSVIIVLLSSYVLHILLPEHEDWELFSYSFFGSVFLFGLSIVLLIIASFLLKNVKLNNVLFLIILILLLELSSIIIAGESIFIRIFTTMAEDKNWIMIAYPMSIILSYFLSKKIIKILENKSQNS